MGQPFQVSEMKFFNPQRLLSPKVVIICLSNEVHLDKEHKESINRLSILDLKYHSTASFFFPVLESLLHYCEVFFLFFWYLVIKAPLKESETHLVCIYNSFSIR